MVQIAGLGHVPPQDPIPPIARQGPTTQTQSPVCASCKAGVKGENASREAAQPFAKNQSSAAAWN